MLAAACCGTAAAAAEVADPGSFPGCSSAELSLYDDSELFVGGFAEESNSEAKRAESFESELRELSS